MVELGLDTQNRTSLPLAVIKPSSPYNIEVSLHITHAPAPTKPSTDSAEPKHSLPQNFIFINVWTKLITSQLRSHMSLRGSSEQEVVYCSDPLQPVHIWHTSLLCYLHPTLKLTIMAIEEPATDCWPPPTQWTGHVLQHQFGSHTVQMTHPPKLNHTVYSSWLF